MTVVMIAIVSVLTLVALLAHRIGKFATALDGVLWGSGEHKIDRARYWAERERR